MVSGGPSCTFCTSCMPPQEKRKKCDDESCRPWRRHHENLVRAVFFGKPCDCDDNSDRPRPRGGGHRSQAAEGRHPDKPRNESGS
jgi:hypothetical protein